MRVIGTAGHVDHGKSTLIAALTGVHPDRLKEEKEREMTIDLGFGWLCLPDGQEIGIVDVPGHRDFIENMLAGIGGIDAVMLVIAADEGVMPQTREHLAIIDLLQVRAGVVVLTKIDLAADPAWLDLVETDVRTCLQDTVLADAPILRVSSHTKEGFPELTRNLSVLMQDLPARADLGRPRLPIDRVFSMPGFGTVVTGTLTNGTFSSGKEVTILPSGISGRIRGLQVHNRKVDNTSPGSRTALNISGVNMDQVLRGEVVTYPGQYQPTQRVDVHFRLLPDVSSPLHHHTQVKLFLGTAEIITNIRLLGAEVLNPGETAWLQLDLQQPIVAMRGDRFILRRPSPGETLGGGMVVDPQPKKRHKRFEPQVIRALERLAQGSPSDVLLQASLALGPSSVEDVIIRSQLDRPEAENILQEMVNGGSLVRLENVIMAAGQWTALKDSVLAKLAQYHQNYPLRRGMPREELKSRHKLSPQVFNLLVARMSQEGFLVERPGWIMLPGHIIGFSPKQQNLVNHLMSVFITNPFSPPSVKECQAEVGEDVFNALLELGDLIAVSQEVVFRKVDFDTMQARLHQFLREKGQVSLAEVRDLFSTSRKYAQALLEYLDSIGLTIRNGDVRKLRNA